MFARFEIFAEACVPVEDEVRSILSQFGIEAPAIDCQSRGGVARLVVHPVAAGPDVVRAAAEALTRSDAVRCADFAFEPETAA